MASGDTVLSTPAADQWRILLHAIGEPTSSRWARAFALSWFGGETAATVAELDDDAIAIIQNRLASWAETLLTHGIGAFLAVVWTQSAIAPRVLERFDGDRSITDLEHVAELLRSASPHDRSSVAGLLASLDTETAPKSAEKEDDVAARRVESDDEAVQVMTIFKAKGLEFPIVLVPIMWKTPYKAKKKAIDVTYTDPATGNRIYDLTGGMGWPDDETAQNRRELAEAEALGQQQRLLYVALTRAKHRTVVWWASVDNGGDSALAHLLFARDDEGAIDRDAFVAHDVSVPSNDQIGALLEALVARSEGLIEVSTHGMAAPAAPWNSSEEERSDDPLAVATLDRVLDRSRHRWSFTALTRRFEEASIDPLDPSLGDRGAYDEPPDADGEDEAAASVPVVSTSSALTALPAGTEFGTLVHSVLERVDFTADDLQDAVGLALAEVDHTGAGIPMTDGNGDRVDGSPLLTTGLAQAISTPLGSLLGDVSLRQFGPDRRLNELAFELPLRTRGHAATVAGIGRLITDHLGPDDVLARWASALRDGAFDVDLAGHLTGSIDLVLRLDDGRFVVADYKSNRLVPAGTVPPPDAYGRDALAGAMAEHHYPLQALLYEVALHRYLRWRLGPAYSPGDHLGGSAYLFVRGMAGPDTPSVDGHRDGVFDWAVPADLIVELSDLLDGTSTKAKTA